MEALQEATARMKRRAEKREKRGQSEKALNIMLGVERNVILEACGDISFLARLQRTGIFDAEKSQEIQCFDMLKAVDEKRFLELMKNRKN